MPFQNARKLVDDTCLIASSAGMFSTLYPSFLNEPMLLKITQDGTITVILYTIIGTITSCLSKFAIEYFKKKRQQ